jgi:hypothetical protein
MQKCILDSATKIVVNVIEIDDGVEWHPSEGTELAPQHDGNMFDTWDGTKFVAPVIATVPEQDINTIAGSPPNVIG